MAPLAALEVSGLQRWRCDRWGRGNAMVPVPRCEVARRHRPRGGFCGLPVVGVQLGTRSPDESLAGYMLVAMTMASEGVILCVGGVILKSVPVARFFSG